MERQIAIAYLNLTRVFNALQISSLGLEDLQTLNLEAWKLAAHCDRFPEWFDSYMDPSFLVSDCLEHVLHSSRGLFVGTLEDRWQQIETIDGLLDFLEQLKLLLASEGTMEEGNDRVVHLEGPIGQFLRRIVIALESLSFEDLCLLLDYWHSLDASVSKKEFPMPTSSALDFQVPSSLLPQVDHESHLLLESMSYGVISSYEDMEKILNITTNDSSTTKTELVRFLQSIENADLDSAVSSLHRYFDMELCSLNCGPQQASLLLAAAYFTLGVQSLAVMNLHETVIEMTLLVLVLISCID